MTEIEVTISPNGKMKLEVKGVCGPQCVDITKPIIQKLGIVTAEMPTEEYYQEISESQEVNQ